MFPFSSEQNGRGEVKSTLVDFIRTKKQSKTKKQTQSSSLSSLPCYENAFIFAGLLTIFQDGTSHTVSSGTADIVSAGRQPLSGLYFTRFSIKHFYRGGKKKIFEIRESLSLSDKDEFWLIFF